MLYLSCAVYFILLLLFAVFFFKQKTAYEIVDCDWSSDVCSSDLNIEAAALEFTGIKLDHPLRMAVSEEAALTDIFRGVRKALKANGCKRAILVGHNSSFDLGFLNAAVARLDMKRNPFHPFSSFDTATLAGLAYGQTVLAKACQAAGIDFDGREAHSARYDTEKTADLFCGIVNRWKQMGGWEDFGD